MSPIKFEILFSPPQELVELIDKRLVDYNNRLLGVEKIDYEMMVVDARDEAGNIIGGLSAELFWGWMHVQDLWVDEQYRGRDIGTILMTRAEQSAKGKGINRFHLETTSFQALDFYQKLGYEVFGRLEDKPPGHIWYFLKKEPDD